jgi:hypothetical protein
MQVLHGTTRVVILTKRFAFKFPTYVSWRLFLNGLLCNMQEKQFSGTSPNLCPVLWSLPGGFLVVMPRCEPITRATFFGMDVQTFIEQPDMFLPVENKQDSFGWYKDRIVAVDYGS